MPASEPIEVDEPSGSESVITAGPPATEAGGTLTIDLNAIEANWKALARRAMPAECAAVIKADGYGCGIEAVATMLSKAGCKTFFVADLSEARRVRAVAQEPTIYVLNGLMPNTASTFAELHVRPVIGGMTEFAEWDAFCATSGWRGGAALHVDTGMNRLGITVDEAAALAPRIRAENHGITLLMSHFACSELPDHPLNEQQIKLFRDIRVLYRGIPSSLANCSGIFLGPAAHCDMVRPHPANRTRCSRSSRFKGASLQSAMSRAARPSAMTPAGRPGAPLASPSSASAMPTATCARPAPPIP
jgi:alanine racemase